ncbi:MAG TPA: aconitate hydratase AcnA [Anaerolineales bacterium]|nr:aconitate hydratase AcnA [Anaerolineales bacterium]
MTSDPFNARATLNTAHGDYTYYRLASLEEAGLTKLDRLPFSIRILLEQALRQMDGVEITDAHVRALAGWTPTAEERPVVAFKPARVVMQDFTGVPAVVDLAAMRSAVARLGGNPSKINPVVPVDLVIDHSVQVDFFGSPNALQRNAEIEFERNRERYEFLHWGKNAFANFRVVPPATGIVHQVNLEFLSKVVMAGEDPDGGWVAYPDTLVGTDSHTTMINGLGVLGWGVGGIEAEAAVVGVPLDMLAPDVIGFKLSGRLPEGVTATDLVLTVAQMMRKKGVVGKFIEFYGPGIASMSLPDRATIANMAPEHGATVCFFPVDDETLRYLRLTGRTPEEVERVEAYCRAQNLFRTAGDADPEFTDTLELDMGAVVPSLAGPKLPHQRIGLAEMKEQFEDVLATPKAERGFEIPPERRRATAVLGANGSSVQMGHGSVIIAAITSCTNTSNPSVMLGAGLLARNAVARGLQVKPFVKTSLAPGSKVVTEYLEHAGLIEPLAELGFNVVGYGCTTCIGNSGPLAGEVVRAIQDADLVSAAVLSGNRNFEGRIHPYSLANYLASPPLVVAYALAGTVDIDLEHEPLGTGSDGEPVYLREIWPSPQEIREAITTSVRPAMFVEKYSNVFDGNETWNAIPAADSADLYNWDEASTYIQEPPFFTDLTPEVRPIEPIRGARVLVKVGDSVTTDHISPAGAIPADFPAGQYLIERGVSPREFNSFGSRRGNDRVMTRGTFGNIRLKNHLAGGKEGSWTVKFPENEELFIYDAAMKYQAEGTPLIVLAGTAYGTGSSRDWAAKGTLLLGVKAVIAGSYEKIHRSNLFGMGVLPLEFAGGQSAAEYSLDGSETYDIPVTDDVHPNERITVTATRANGDRLTFDVIVRLDTPIEVEYYRHGGILHKAIRDMLS